MLILYGLDPIFADVTDVCLRKKFNNIICVPDCDSERYRFFEIDPRPGIVKIVKIVDDYGNIKIFKNKERIFLTLNKSKLNFNNDLIQENLNSSNEMFFLTEKESEIKLRQIHSKLSLRYGSFDDEFPEQIMSIMFIHNRSKVLELGSNIGRNTLIISSILENDLNLVTMETDPNTIIKLEENKIINNKNFHIENSALSKKRLVQQHGSWDTFVCEDESNLMPDFFLVPTIDWESLKSKYNIDFDTLVLDCEGAFFQILLDMEEILDNIKTIIIENDFRDLSHKIYVDSVLTRRGFRTVYSKSGGWGPCYDFFFQVFMKDD